MKIEGYFTSMKRANETIDKLNSSGIKGAFVDINEHRTEAYSQSGQVGSFSIPTLSSAVMGEDGEENSPLAAASPMASGMGGFEEIANINCKVIVETDDDKSDKVKQIIKDMGGTLEEPNAKIPQGLENINQNEVIMKNLQD